jgi:hypothetical protein
MTVTKRLFYYSNASYIYVIFLVFLPRFVYLSSAVCYPARALEKPTYLR